MICTDLGREAAASARARAAGAPERSEGDSTEDAAPDGAAKSNHGQRASRAGAAALRVCQLPSGALYFSPGLVRAIAWHPAVSA